jgi:hypothetical protein
MIFRFPPAQSACQIFQNVRNLKRCLCELINFYWQGSSWGASEEKGGGIGRAVLGVRLDEKEEKGFGLLFC